MKEIVEKIIIELDKSMSEDYEGDKPKFSREGYKTFEISEKNFHNVDVLKDDRKICCVDGGNSEILGSANFSLQLIRVYAYVSLKNKFVSSEKNDFFLLIKTVGGKEIKFNCEIFPIKGDVLIDCEDLELDISDETIKQGIFNAKTEKIGELARRFSEIKIAEKIIGKLDPGDMIVMDGTLESSYTNEQKYLEKLYEKAKQRKVLVVALAKTTTMLTEKGNNLLGLLNNIGEEKLWYYHPLAEVSNQSHKADICVAKLNKKTEHVFRIEIYKEQKQDINKAIEMLASNSTDLSFPGYPYGLVKADSLARVSNSEKEHYKALLIAKTGKKCNKLAKYLSSANSHSILDKQH